jgi:signal transduction histidine kinase
VTALGRWFRPPRHVLALFLGVTGALSLAMGWLAWQLIAQDRTVASQRRQERLENAGETAVASLRKGLEDLAQRLELLSRLPAAAGPPGFARQASMLGGDAALILADDRAFDAWPADILLYYPDAALGRGTLGTTPAAFADGEALEFERRDLNGALRTFRPFTLSSDPRLRAGGWLRSARIWTQLQKPGLARHAYDELAALEATPVENLPAGLLARYGRCLLFKDIGSGVDLAREAGDLSRELDAGRWRLTAAEYQFYRERVREWLPPTPGTGSKSGTDERERLSAAVVAVWDGWRDPRSVTPRTGCRLVRVDGTALLILWNRAARGTVVLSGGPRFIESHFLQPANAALNRHRARVVLADDENARGEETVGGDRPARRAAAETHLPWSVLIVDADPRGELAAASARNRIVVAGLVALGLFVLIGSAFVIRAVNRELEVSRLQTDFVAAVSHQLRTPLTSIRQVSELLLDGRVPEARREEYYRMQHRNSERLQRLVESLLDFGRMESGVHEYRLEPLDVTGLVREVVEEFGAEVAAAGYRVAAALPADRLLVSADREALGRAVWNLLDNAVKYSPSHKTVWVAVALGDSGLEISVRDRGVGVPVEERRRIFDKFARGASAVESGAKGTGLGLAMVQHIVKAHRGSVRVESVPAEGSTFTIVVPALRMPIRES